MDYDDMCAELDVAAAEIGWDGADPFSEAVRERDENFDAENDEREWR